MTGTELQAKRRAAGIPAVTLALRCGTSRSRMSDIERGNVLPTPEEFERIGMALDQLIAAKETLRQTAIALGWPAPGGVR